MIEFSVFEAILKEAFPEVTDDQVEKYRQLEELYKDWNSKINVISRKDMDGIYDHHVLHSLAIAYFLKIRKPEEYSSLTAPDGGVRILDLGTGGGLILLPETRFLLCDSIRKKTTVASEVAKSLGLQNVEVANARAESLPGKFDYVVSRAVASLSDFYPWVKGKYTKGILYLKGGEINEEISEMMMRFKMRKGSVSTWPVTSWLQDNYFEGKFVINIL